MESASSPSTHFGTYLQSSCNSPVSPDSRKPYLGAGSFMHDHHLMTANLSGNWVSSKPQQITIPKRLSLGSCTTSEAKLCNGVTLLPGKSIFVHFRLHWPICKYFLFCVHNLIASLHCHRKGELPVSCTRASHFPITYLCPEFISCSKTFVAQLGKQAS